jgi:hypothetical protein
MVSLFSTGPSRPREDRPRDDRPREDRPRRDGATLCVTSVLVRLFPHPLCPPGLCMQQPREHDRAAIPPMRAGDERRGADWGNKREGTALCFQSCSAFRFTVVHLSWLLT